MQAIDANVQHVVVFVDQPHTLLCPTGYFQFLQSGKAPHPVV